MSRAITQNQIKTMLTLQYKLNSIVDSKWIEKKFPYLRAAFVEAAEALDHYGWKWWKQQATNLPQVQIEISDILHFYLSDLLISTDGNIDKSADIFRAECSNSSGRVILDSKTYVLNEIDTQTVLELLAALSVLRKRNFSVLQVLMFRCGLNWQALYTSYVSKNVLNIFRQDNGYKNGSYIKIWADREDNEYLAEIAAELNPESPRYSEDIYYQLSQKYQSLK